MHHCLRCAVDVGLVSKVGVEVVVGVEDSFSEGGGPRVEGWLLVFTVVVVRRHQKPRGGGGMAGSRIEI